MSKLKVACWIVGTVMFLTVIFFQFFKPSSPQDEWENVNAKMADTLQLESTVETKNSTKSTEHDAEIPKQQVDTPNQNEVQNEAQNKAQNKAQKGTQNEPQTNAATQESPQSDLINLNSATIEQLDALPGIGPSKARAIIDYRTKYGNFRSLEQLMEVKGIGPKIFAKMKEKITIAT